MQPGHLVQSIVRVRTSDYRIVYTVRDEVLLVLVVALDHPRVRDSHQTGWWKGT